MINFFKEFFFEVIGVLFVYIYILIVLLFNWVFGKNFPDLYLYLGVYNEDEDISEGNEAEPTEIQISNSMDNTDPTQSGEIEDGELNFTTYPTAGTVARPSSPDCDSDSIASSRNNTPTPGNPSDSDSIASSRNNTPTPGNPSDSETAAQIFPSDSSIPLIAEGENSVLTSTPSEHTTSSFDPETVISNELLVEKSFTERLIPEEVESLRAELLESQDRERKARDSILQEKSKITESFLETNAPGFYNFEEDEKEILDKVENQLNEAEIRVKIAESNYENFWMYNGGPDSDAKVVNSSAAADGTTVDLLTAASSSNSVDKNLVSGSDIPSSTNTGREEPIMPNASTSSSLYRPSENTPTGFDASTTLLPPKGEGRSEEENYSNEPQIGEKRPRPDEFDKSDPKGKRKAN